MLENDLLEFLERNDAVLTGRHFVFTSGNHGPAYINMRAIAHKTPEVAQIGRTMGILLFDQYRRPKLDIIIGPETLGRTLAPYACEFTTTGSAIWCEMEGEGDDKKAVFSPKFPLFAGLLQGKRVGIVDDLLTTGSSVRAVAKLVRDHGGDPVVAAVAVRRTPDVTAVDCGVGNLIVLAEVEGFKVFTEQECAEYGPCSQNVPVVLRPGHGYKWIKDHRDYPHE